MSITPLYLSNNTHNYTDYAGLPLDEAARVTSSRRRNLGISNQIYWKGQTLYNLSANTQGSAAGDGKKLVDRFMAGKPKIVPRNRYAFKSIHLYF
jgi:hypothetical protein